MKINFTKKEYRLLVEMLYLADWVMHAHDIEFSHKEHLVLKEKLFSYSKEMEAEDIIEHSKESDDYCESHQLEQAMQEKFINFYDEQTFWEELLERLSERDVVKKIGLEKYSSLGWIEKGTEIDKVKERYAAEFETHGLNCLKVETLSEKESYPQN